MGMLLHGPVTSQTIDSSGEILDLEGHDITDFLEGKAFANWEHSNDSPEDIVGRFVYAKKIFSAKDCDNELQKKMWNQIKVPFLYGVCELFDDEDHPGAIAISSMVNYFKNRNEKVEIGFSIEGSTLERDGNELKRSVGRRAAITLRPCNKTCWAEFLDEKDFKSYFKKNEEGIGNSNQTIQLDFTIFDDQILEMQLALQKLQKTLEAGVASSAPSNLTQGAALQSEDRNLRNKIKAVVRDWDKKKPLRATIKAQLPEVSDEYLDHFDELADELSLKKGEAIILTSQNAPKWMDEAQKDLIDGVFIRNKNESKPFKASNSNSKTLILKINITQSSNMQNPAKYYFLARNFFRLQDCIPLASYFNLGDMHGYAEESRPTLSPIYSDHPFMKQPIYEMMQIADMVLGVFNRDASTLLCDNESNGLYHSASLDCFNYRAVTPKINQNDIISSITKTWLKMLDLHKLIQMLKELKCDAATIKKACIVLQYIQTHCNSEGLSSMKFNVDAILNGQEAIQ